MGLAYILPVNAGENLYNVVTLTPGSPPPRPHPRPPGPSGPPPWGIDIAPPYPDIGGPGDQPYPDQGLPGYQPRPGHDLPLHPSQPIYIPSPPEVNPPLPPIVLPEPPQLPPGSAVVVPVPEGATVPPAPAGTPPSHTEAYVLYFGPGTVASVIYLPPVATSKPSKK